MVQQKRSSTFIKELEDAQGNLVSSSSHIPTMITYYYQSLFSSQVTAEDSALLDLIPSIITSEHNSMLLAPPSIEEVREVEVVPSWEREIERIWQYLQFTLSIQLTENNTNLWKSEKTESLQKKDLALARSRKSQL